MDARNGYGEKCLLAQDQATAGFVLLVIKSVGHWSDFWSNSISTDSVKQQMAGGRN